MPKTTATDTDVRHLRRAIELAARARGQTSPNPIVGAVVVKEDRVVGEGITQPPGEDHAEVMALAESGDHAAGATMYLSLEPCCHHGRTPPCTDAILSAGIRRVVIASDDPTPKAAGRGPGILRDEGVRVDFVDGDIADAARMLNQPFLKHARTGRPLVIFKSAMTLDGKVATRTGDSQWISGEASRARAHRWRAESDAVAVGIGTALVDDPRLTARIEGVARQPRRVVFDSEGRLPLDSRLVKDVSDVPLIVVCSRAAKRTSVEALQAAGVDVIVATGENEGARVQHALDELGAREIQSLLLEGGPHLAGAFLEAEEIDEVRVFIAPVLLGGAKARTAVEGIGFGEIAAAPRPLAIETERIDDDVLFVARFKEW
ncbi:MAG TPA: bifunctional diaminohydroxyphosphoribosylaminopyrimidine deaminase/5-amino-6-(5-phosphoribosylamino)uracil reductase RibD [Thermoleophilaceae bacterium]|jgi:diaminohydroxyphosphoribosylaminopyrimidine deaminase/5-amino-6-(5-phosphoribosylamino)uracil reductase|nr:bifunctional diaminohydroxyphosphoribosylaminopyrimidine deaminase/5-amino-6-(5-phosphoribosylamino)uracil reductase RibD [Thermoleophilaceae bacterium]